jgi:hypothetical protein
LSVFEVDAGGFLYLPLAVVREFLAHDLPEAEVRVIAAAQPRIRVSALLDRGRSPSPSLPDRSTLDMYHHTIIFSPFHRELSRHGDHARGSRIPNERRVTWNKVG